MLPFLENTWPVWWILATLALLRWFHVNALTLDDCEIPADTPAAPPTSRDASPQAV